jgi:hypothetical protein
MADLTKLKRGPEHMVSSGGKGRFLPAIYWKDNNESRYLAFVTPVAEVPKLPIHFIRTANGWRDFVCRKSEIFEDENPTGACEICDRYKKKPDFKAVALAAELTPEFSRENGRKRVTGFEMLMDEWESEQDGKTETRQAPHVGIIKQAFKNFWTPFVAEIEREQTRNGVGDLNEVVYEIVRVGKGNSTTYKFYAYEERPDLSEYLDGFPTLEDWIEEKGSLAYYENELSGGVEPDEPEDDEPEAPREKGDTSDARSRFDELAANLQQRDEEPEAEATA